ncbi:MAG: TolC family protein [Ignavibacteriales bacterium]|nr:TolC family protein [Ignavibacteriales bacterium]
MNRIVVAAAFLVIIPAFLKAQEAEPEDLQFLVIEALMVNPQIAAEVARMRSAESRIPQAGSLDDPELTFKQMEIPGTSLGKAMSSNIELMQMIPFPTKLSLRSRIASVRAEHAHHEHLERVVAIIEDLKSSYAMLWYARTALAINRDNQSLLSQIVRTAETQYAVGRVSQQDVLRARIELARTRSEEAVLRQETITAESMLRALLNRTPNAPVGPVTMYSLKVPTVTEEALIRYALANRPMVVHDSLSIYETELMVSMAKQEFIPDFRISLEYIQSPELGNKRWSIMAGISIPFVPWNLAKAFGRVEEARAEQAMKTSMFQASKNMVVARIKDAYAKLHASAVLSQTYEREILPQSRQSLSSLMTEYQTGRTSYLMLIDGYRMYQMVRMESAMARMRYEQAVAALERQVGVIDLSIVPE